MLAAAALLGACGTAPPPAGSVRADATEERAYGQDVEQLAAMARKAETLYKSGKADDAADLVTKGEALADRLLAVPKPTLAAMEAISDLDQLYGRMLLANRNYGWARLLFQKNRARWKTWQPQTPETQRRLREAETAIDECDRHLTE